MNIQYKINTLSSQNILTFTESDRVRKYFDPLPNNRKLSLKEKRKFIDRRIMIKIDFNIVSIKNIEYMKLKIYSYGRIAFLYLVLLHSVFIIPEIQKISTLSDFIYKSDLRSSIDMFMIHSSILFIIFYVQKAITRPLIKNLIRHYFSQPEHADEIVLD